MRCVSFSYCTEELARARLALKLAERPLASPHLQSVELLRELSKLPEMVVHSATIEYVVGVLTAGDAYRPNLDIQLVSILQISVL